MRCEGLAAMAVTVVCTVLASFLAHGFSANPMVASLTAEKQRSQKRS